MEASVVSCTTSLGTQSEIASIDATATLGIEVGIAAALGSISAGTATSAFCVDVLDGDASLLRGCDLED